MGSGTCWVWRGLKISEAQGPGCICSPALVCFHFNKGQTSKESLSQDGRSESLGSPEEEVQGQDTALQQASGLSTRLNFLHTQTGDSLV